MKGNFNEKVMTNRYKAYRRETRNDSNHLFSFNYPERTDSGEVHWLKAVMDSFTGPMNP